MEKDNFLVKIEEEILSFWKKRKIFERSLKERKGRREFVFYEGPPSANAKPGLHHALSRSYKDIICRFKTMEGFLVKRKAGWDTHGLPIELQVEKKFNFKRKQDVLKFGIKRFNEECKKLVFLYKKDWDKLTERLGYWLDLANPYITLDTAYIENLWFLIKRLYEKGLLYKGYRVSPYCPRCQTVLSSHEVAQEYHKVKDLSLYVKVKVISSDRSFKRASLLIWTTTPWTLPANIAIAVNPDLTYILLETKNKERVVVLKSLASKLFGKDYKKVRALKGEELLGLKYEPIFKSKSFRAERGARAFEVVGGEFVSQEEGTGLVHLAPAFGDEDNRLLEKIRKGGKENDFPVFITVNEKGEMKKGVVGEGLFVKEADKLIIEALKKKGKLFKVEECEHDYPFCWRCKTPLLYYPRESWFVRMSSLRKELLKNNQKINWVPGHIKNGRFGEWLKEVKDWAFSRDRFWGTPLPVWQDEKTGEIKVVGSLEELRENSYYKNTFFLLRHAQSESNLKNLVVSEEKGKEIFPLTIRGKKEVKKLAEELKKKKIDFIFSSPLSRTRETAEIIAQSLKVPLKVDERLKEIQVGVFNLKHVKDYESYFSDQRERITKKPIGGENLENVAKRVVNFIEEVNKKYQGKRILIVSHGDPLRIIAGKMSAQPWDKILKSKPFSLLELRRYEWAILPFNGNLEVDLHRPYIDKIVLRSSTGGKMRIDSRVADVWFDSGAMPIAQNYDFISKVKRSSFEEAVKEIDFPADYISEGIDQTRGWFYTLLAVSTALGLGPSYKNVICLGHILDDQGLKMSKSKGNIVDPFYALDTYGADALRWYFYSYNPAGEPKKFSEKDLQSSLRRFVLTYWNVFNFWKTYKPEKLERRMSKRFLVFRSKPKNLLDTWIISRLEETKLQVKKLIDQFLVYESAAKLDKFLDDFSRWYLRRSRERLQGGKTSDWKTFSYLLAEFSKMVAPFVPFISEKVWQGLSISGEKESIHLTDYPKANKSLIKKSLLGDMDLIRSIAGRVSALRKEKNIRLRQPLSVLVYEGKKRISRQLLEVLAEETNVKKIERRKIKPAEKRKWLYSEEAGMKIALNPEIDLALKVDGLARELIRQIQTLRKDLGLLPKEMVEIGLEAKNEEASLVLKTFLGEIKRKIKAKSVKSVSLRSFDGLRETNDWTTTLKKV